MQLEAVPMQPRQVFEHEVQIVLEAPLQVPERNWVDEQSAGTVQGLHLKLAVRVHVPERNWPAGHSDRQAVHIRFEVAVQGADSY